MEKEKFNELKPDKSSFDSLLSKYSIIWIWSILITINSGITYTFYNFNISDYGNFSLILIAINIVAFMCSVLSWSRLYLILKILILPNLFENKFYDDEYRKNNLLKEKFFIVSSSFQYLIYAIVLRFSAYILELVFNVLFHR